MNGRTIQNDIKGQELEDHYKSFLMAKGYNKNKKKLIPDKVREIAEEWNFHGDKDIDYFFDLFLMSNYGSKYTHSESCFDQDSIYSIAGSQEIVNMVTSDEYEQVNIVAMVRPPGHHAEKDKADGFCYKNNVASLVKRTREKHPNAKILVIDLDVHHGNGTISIFNDEQYDVSVTNQLAIPIFHANDI
ncbi:MAG: hypothetical protein GY821_04010 [Gammaproteobacteria bacterium]|nr:hypothetical protein [Gammaproteobacteria bacterium]